MGTHEAMIIAGEGAARGAGAAGPRGGPPRGGLSTYDAHDAHVHTHSTDYANHFYVAKSDPISGAPPEVVEALEKPDWHLVRG